MTRQDFFHALWQMVKDTDVDYQELSAFEADYLDDGDGGVYLKFTNVVVEDELEKATKDKIIAIIEEHVKVPDSMRDHLCDTLYKAYVEAREEIDNA